MLYRTFTKREKVLFVFFGILLLGAVYYFVVFRPISDQKIIVQNTIYSQQEEVSIVEAKFLEESRMKNELETLPKRSELKPIEKYDNVNGVMEFLNTTMEPADDFNITFANVEVGDKFIRRTLAITFTSGNKDTARSMIDKLFDADFRSQVNDFNLSYDADGGCNVNMTLTFFEII